MAKDIMVVATISSLEVAKMMEKTHDNLMKNIRKYSKYIEEANDSLGLVKNDESSEDDLGELNFQPSSEKNNAVKNDAIKDNDLKIEVVKDDELKIERISDGFIDLDDILASTID